MTATLPLWLGLAIVAVLLSVGPIAHAVRSWRERLRALDDGLDETAAD